jgi:hypothetical protein
MYTKTMIRITPAETYTMAFSFTLVFIFWPNEKSPAEK